MNIINLSRKIMLFLAFIIPCTAGADWVYFVSRESNTLQRADIGTFDLETIGALNFDYRWGGLAWDPETRKLFLITDESEKVDFPKLYLVDPITANSELLGTIEVPQYGTGNQHYGLDYIAETGQLMMSYSSRVLEIDLEDLSVDELADSDSSDHRFGSLAYDSLTEKLYTYDSDGTSYLVKSRSIKLDCQSPQYLEGGVAYDSENDIFWQTNLTGVSNQIWSRSMGPRCVNNKRADDVGQWADNLAFVPETEIEFRITPALNDTWFNPATDGQGFLLSVFPDIKQMFVAWFTYDVERPPDDVTAMLGEPGHRWLTAQGPYDGDTANLKIFVTAGGVFDSANPPAVTDPNGDGTMKIEFAGCNDGLVEYTIASLNISGSIPIERVVLDNVAACEDLFEP